KPALCNIMGAATILEGAACRVSDDSCGWRKYMTVRIRRNVSRTNKIDMGVAPYVVRDISGTQSRSCSVLASARGVQIASSKGALVLNGVSCLEESCTTAFCSEASHFAVVDVLPGAGAL